MQIGKSANWFVKDVKESEQKRSARAPFTTSSLQQTASSRFRIFAFSHNANSTKTL